MQTVQVLEQKILSGETVRPDEMAQAIAADNAAARINELTEKREQIQKETDARENAREQLATLESSLAALIEDDTQGVDLLAKISAAAHDFQNFIATRNRKLEQLRADARKLVPFGGLLGITIDISADGFSQIGDAATSIRYWKDEVETSFTSTINQAVARERQY